MAKATFRSIYEEQAARLCRRNTRYEWPDLSQAARSHWLRLVARSELGRWCGAQPKRYFEQFLPDPDCKVFGDKYSIKLVEDAEQVCFCSATSWAGAVFAALDAAASRIKVSGRLPQGVTNHAH